MEIVAGAFVRNGHRTVQVCVAPNGGVFRDWRNRIAVRNAETGRLSYIPEQKLKRLAAHPPTVPTKTARELELLKALSAAEGYLRNALFDLQAKTPKTTAIATVNGGLALVRAAITKAEEEGE